MKRMTVIALFLLVSCAVLRADEPVQVRTQRVGDVVYFQLRVPAPEGTRVPKSLGKALDKIALHDLARQPHLVPQDERTFAVEWRNSSNTKDLEFLGRCRATGMATWRLLTPTEPQGKRGWSETAVTAELAQAVDIPLPPKRTPSQPPGDDDLEGLWAAAQARAWAVQERLTGDGEFFRFARQSLCRRNHIVDPLPRPALPPAALIEEAPAVDLARLPEIDAAEHPWERLLAAKTPAIEALAKLVPHDFYYVRFRNVDEAPTQLAEWASAVLSLLDGQGRDFQLRERYERQRCFPLNADGRPRLPNHIREFAIVGSDLHFRAGTDVTTLFVMSNVEKFRGEADEAIQVLRKEQRLEERRDDAGGVTIESFQTADRSISLHRAYVGNVAVFSNSAAAVRRILATHAGKTRALANAPDFRLLRTVFEPSAAREQLLVYASEAFLRNQFGPAQLIKAKRRDEALALLRALQFAALSCRFETGRPIKDLAALAQVAGIKPDDPRLANEGYTWDLQRQQVYSRAGKSVAFATPLLEYPLERISRTEEAFYQSYLDGARDELLPYLAPAGIRLGRTDGKLHVDVFAMPPERATAWQTVLRRVGRGTVERPEADPHVPARLTVSYASDPADQAKLQEMLIKAGVDKKYFVKHAEWRGDRIVAQLDDSPALARLAEYFLHLDLTTDDLARSHDSRDLRLLLARLPLTVAIEIRRPLIFLGWITQTKKALTESFPNVFTWETLPGTFRTIKLNRIQLNQAVMLVLFGKLLKPEEAPAIWYAFNNRLLLLGLHEAAMKNGVSRELLPRERRRGEWVNAALDLNLAASPELQKSLHAYLARAGQRQALAVATYWATLVRAGVIAADTPERQREENARRWLGFIPAAPGRSGFRYDAVTGEFVHPHFGSARQPQLPAEPMKDSPVVRMLADLQRLRADLHVRNDGVLLQLTLER